MRQYKKSCFMVFFFLICLIAGNAMAAKRVVVITGLNESSVKDVGNYDIIYDGIKEGMKDNGVELVFQFADLASLPTDELNAAADKAAAVAHAAKPDLIILLDDVTVQYLSSRIEDIPVVFAWIFSNPKSLGLPKKNVTGVVRRSYAGDIFATMAKLNGSKTVSLISKTSQSMAGVRQYILAGADQLEAASGVKVKEMYLVNTFEEWESTVKNFKEDFIYLADTSRIIKEGKELLREETTRWTVDHATVPVVGAAEVDVEAGALFAIVTSEKAIGEKAAELALKIFAGTVPADIPYASSEKGKLVINVKTAEKYQMDIPYEILSAAEKIYGEE